MKKREAYLKEGDIIQNLGSGRSYIVISVNPTVAVRSVTVTNPSEWRIINVINVEGDI